MNENEFQGKWNQLKGSIKETWGDLADDALDKVKGKKDKLIGLIQESYGDTKENIQKKLNALLKNIK